MRCLILLLASLAPGLAFQSCNVVTRMHRTRPSSSLLLSSDDDESDQSVDENYNSELDELTRPSVSFTQNSLLFGDNPPTQKDNGPLWIWQGAKTYLPNFVTGAWEEVDGDKRPVEHLYNMVFVRLPTVGMGFFYVRNLLSGHPMIVNFGDGTMFEVPSIIVFGIIAVILR